MLHGHQVKKLKLIVLALVLSLSILLAGAVPAFAVGISMTADPVDGATGVPVGGEIVIDFNVYVVQDIYYNNIYLRNEDTGTVVPINKEVRDINLSGHFKQLALIPQAQLDWSTDYYFYIPAGAVKDPVSIIPMSNAPKGSYFTTAPEPAVITLDVTPSPVDIAVGETQPLTVVVGPAGTDVAFASGDDSVATVDAAGVITGVCNGTAIITVNATKAGLPPVAVDIQVNVSKGTIDLDVTPATLDFTIGVNVDAQIDATADPAATITYQSSNESVVTVDGSGNVSAVCDGDATITVTASRPCYEDAVVVIPVTVNKGSIDLDVTPVSLEFTIGVDVSASLNATADPAATITYQSSNESVVTVDGSGNVSAVCDGDATITVTASRPCYEDAVVVIPVTVNKGSIDLDVTPVSLEFTIGVDVSASLNATADPAATITYQSSNESVATVDGSGNVSAVCDGDATITVTASKPCYEDAVVVIPVTVNRGTIDFTADPASMALLIGGSDQIDALVNPADATVTFASSDESVATVDGSGNVTAVGEGDATITVTASKPCYNDAFVEVPVTVTAIKVGDVNGDGSIDVADVVMAVNIILGRIVPTDTQFAAADVNSDGVVNVQDVVLIINLALAQP